MYYKNKIPFVDFVFGALEETNSILKNNFIQLLIHQMKKQQSKVPTLQNFEIGA